MTLLLAGFGLLLLWWLGRNVLRRSPARTARLLRRIGGYGALAAAGMVLVRGRPELGVILGSGPASGSSKGARAAAPLARFHEPGPGEGAPTGGCAQPAGRRA